MSEQFDTDASHYLPILQRRAYFAKMVFIKLLISYIVSDIQCIKRLRR